MQESRKTQAVRPPDFNQKYFQGRVLDVGAGNDLVIPTAIGFDKEDGDANNIAQYFAPESLDTIHSSHCLEHLNDPVGVLQQFYRILRPGGYIISVVPDEDIYELGYFPSLFNPDHKWTFRADDRPTWSEHSLHITQIHQACGAGQVVNVEFQHHHFQKSWLKPKKQWNEARSQVLWLQNFYNESIGRFGYNMHIIDMINNHVAKLGLITDQTMGSALAQIQVIFQKTI